jgi:membrane-associated phospholipid phosphatase
MSDIESAPLKTLRSFSSSSSLVSVHHHNYNQHTTSHRSLFLQATAVVCAALVACLYPRYLIQHMKIEYKSTNNYYVQTTRDSELILNAELSHPLVDPPTVGSAFLLGLSVCMPIIIMIIAVVVTTKSTTRLHALHASLCGFVLAVALVEGGTQLLKFYVRRPRPNYYALCGFTSANRKCASTEANLSFPSGHSSLACNGMMYLVWFGVGQLRQCSRLSLGQKRISGLVLAIVPLSTAAWVGASRLVDKWHHPSDVVA